MVRALDYFSNDAEKKKLTFRLVVSEASFIENTFVAVDFEEKRNREQDVKKAIVTNIKAFNEVYMEGNLIPVQMSAENVGLANRGYMVFTIVSLVIDRNYYFPNRVQFLRYLSSLFTSLGLKVNLNAMNGALIFKDVILYFDGLYKEMEVSSILTASVCNTCNFEFGQRFHCLSVKEEVIDAE